MRSNLPPYYRRNADEFQLIIKAVGLAITSGAATNFKVGWAHSPAQSARKKHFGRAPPVFLALKVRLVVLVSAFVMGSTVWSVSCLLFF